MQNSVDLKKTSVAQDHEDDAATLTQSKADAHSVKTRSIFLQIRQSFLDFKPVTRTVPRFSGSLPDSEGDNQKLQGSFRSSKEACQVQNGFDSRLQLPAAERPRANPVFTHFCGK